MKVTTFKTHTDCYTINIKGDGFDLDVMASSRETVPQALQRQAADLERQIERMRKQIERMDQAAAIHILNQAKGLTA